MFTGHNKHIINHGFNIVSGVFPDNPSLTVLDLYDIRQLEGLFRAHTLKAELGGRCSSEFQDNCLMAYGYIVRMWTVSKVILY